MSEWAKHVEPLFEVVTASWTAALRNGWPSHVVYYEGATLCVVSVCWRVLA